jgi:hypothetical protein
VEILTMKITTLFLAIPLAFGSGIALAQSTTTTETTTAMPAPTVGSTTRTERLDTPDGTVEKNKTTTMNPDGSVSTERSKTVTHE